MAPTSIETRPEVCPACGVTFDRPVCRINSVEVFASARVSCGQCPASSAPTPPPAASAFDQTWLSRMPDEYQLSDPARVPTALRRALDWSPESHPSGLGIVGPAGSGKSMAVACLLRLRQTSFRWFNGSSARSLAIKTATADRGEERARLDAEWAYLYRAGILVLDDVDKAKFTDAWADRLFDLLEQRRNRRLPTMWTANITPAALAAKIGRGVGDAEHGQAIERRLCAGALIIIMP